MSKDPNNETKRGEIHLPENKEKLVAEAWRDEILSL